MRVLYHVTLICPTRDENPGALGDERIYTRWGMVEARKLERKLRERWPGCPITVAKQSPEVREPICC